MGWIKIHDGLLSWEWHDKPEMISFWIHLLLMANFEDQQWHGETIPRGSFATTLNTLSEMVGITVKQVRKCLERLEKTGEVQLKKTNKYTIVTICEYDTYQAENLVKGKQRANKGQTKGKQDREVFPTPFSREETSDTTVSSVQKKDIRNEPIGSQEKKLFAEDVMLTEKEFQTLADKHGESGARWMVDTLSNYKGSSGKKYKSDYKAILTWVVGKYEEQCGRGAVRKSTVETAMEANKGAKDIIHGMFNNERL